jgi:hypothetical protein
MSALPPGADRLVAMRRRGKVPEDLVLVSLIGRLDYPNLTILAKPQGGYDWRSLTGLDVEVFSSMDVALGPLTTVLSGIAAVVPKSMVLTFPGAARVHCGDWAQVSDFKLFDWVPMGLDMHTYRGSKTLATRLWAELGVRIPIPYTRAAEAFLEVAREGLQ